MDNATTVSRPMKTKQRKQKRIRKTAVLCALCIALGLLVGWRVLPKDLNESHAEGLETEEKETISNETLVENAKVFVEEPEFNRVATGDFVPLDVNMDEDLQEFTYYLCSEYDIEFMLVMAVISHESDFDADCISSTNDYGLMQINRGNHEWLSDALGIDNFLDPEQNIRAGVFVLRKLFEQYTETNLVLMAYNMGGGNAEKLWAKGIYSSGYSRAVMEQQAEYEAQLREGD